MRETSEARHQQKAEQSDALDLIGFWAAIIGMAVGAFGPWETASFGLASVFGFESS
jgi:hypothetical protein